MSAWAEFVRRWAAYQAMLRRNGWAGTERKLTYR